VRTRSWLGGFPMNLKRKSGHFTLWPEFRSLQMPLGEENVCCKPQTRVCVEQGTHKAGMMLWGTNTSRKCHNGSLSGVGR
jgi:hypothetical protein